MTDLIPIFPLNLVAYPDEDIPLHIFEDRSKQLLRDIETDGKDGFGISPLIDDVIQDIGTYVRLENVTKRHSDGKLDIVVRGIHLYEIKALRQPYPGRLYDGAEIKRRKLSTAGSLEYNEDILNMLREIFNLLQIKRDLPPSPKAFNTFDIAHFLGLSIEKEYRLLSIRSEMDRQEFVLDHLQKLLPVVQQMKSIQKRAAMNGHFRNLN